METGAEFLMRIAVFENHGSINSRPVFKALIENFRDEGEKFYLNEDRNCDVAIIWSVLWKGRMSANKKIWDDFKSQGKPVVVLEVGGLKREHTWKMAINGINRDADFANQKYDDKRWPLFDIEMKPWRSQGKYILLCCQNTESLQWQGMPTAAQWTEQKIKEIRKHTQRQIIIRPHPRSYFEFNEDKYPNVKFRCSVPNPDTYDDTDFKEVLNDAWAVLNHSSNIGMESVLNGVPVFVSQSSLSCDVGNDELRDIEKPAMPARQNWANRLSYTEWTTQEIRNGMPWARIRKRLEEKYIK